MCVGSLPQNKTKISLFGETKLGGIQLAERDVYFVSSVEVLQEVFPYCEPVGGKKGEHKQENLEKEGMYGSPSSESATEALMAVCRTSDAKICLLTVIPSSNGPTSLTCKHIYC